MSKKSNGKRYVMVPRAYFGSASGSSIPTLNRDLSASSSTTSVSSSSTTSQAQTSSVSTVLASPTPSFVPEIPVGSLNLSELLQPIGGVSSISVQPATAQPVDRSSNVVKRETVASCSLSIPVTSMTKPTCTVPTSWSQNHLSSQGMDTEHMIWAHEIADSSDSVQCTIPVPSSYPSSAIAEINFFTRDKGGIITFYIKSCSVGSSSKTITSSARMQVKAGSNSVQRVQLPNNVSGNYHMQISTDGSFPVYITGLCLNF